MFKYFMWGFYQFVDASLYLIMAMAIFENNMYKDYKRYSFLGFILLMMCLIARLFFYDILVFAPFVILFFASQGSMLKRIGITISTIAIILVIQQFVALIMNPDYFANSSLNTFQIINAYMGIAVLIVAGIIKFIKMRNVQKIHFDDIPSYLYTNIILGLCAGVFPLMLLNFFGEVVPKRLYYSIMFVSYLGLICSTVTVILFIKNFQEKNKYFDESQLKDQLLLAQKEYYDETVKNYEYIRSFKHDIKAHLRVLIQLEKNHNYKELHTHLLELQDTIQEHGNFQCSNIYVAAVINSFQNEMKQNDMQLDIEYSVNGEITLDSIDICSLFHNLLSNAITEEMKMTDFDKCISLMIVSYHHHLQIEITNHVTPQFDVSHIKDMVTTKTNRRDHGIGLHNIYKIVNKYHGRLTYEYDENKITFCIILQDVVHY